MKNLFFGLLAAAVLTACGGVENTPEGVAKAYAEAISQMDFETAKKYADKSTGELLDMMKGFTEMASDEDKEKAKSSKVTKVECDEVVDDKTKCRCTIEAGDDSKVDSYDLKKEDGKWLVHMDKDGGGSSDDAGEGETEM